MQLREVNVNAMPRAAGAKPPAPTAAATYVSPPRQVPCTPPRDVPYHTPAAGAAAAAAAACYPPSPNTAGYTPEEMLAMAEASYAECPCPTCAYYRAYYEMQVHRAAAFRQMMMQQHMYAAPAAPAAPAAVAPAPLSAAAGGAARRVNPKIPLMLLQTPPAKQQPPARGTPVQAPPAPHFYDPAVSSNSHPHHHAMGGHTAAAPPQPQPQQSQPLAETDPVATFEAECAGRVVELACDGAGGRAALLQALRTRDPSVLAAAAAEMAAELERVALDASGSQVLRALLEAAGEGPTATVLAALEEPLLLRVCTTSQHSRRLVQTLYERRAADLAPVTEALARNAPYLAETQQGCIALMRAYEQCGPADQAALVARLLPNLAALAFSPFGNYVVQCAVEHSERGAAAAYVVRYMAGQLLAMSCNKFASNVVEKVVRRLGDVPAVRHALLDELVYSPAALQEMVCDGFGNFVVQAIVECSSNAVELKRIFERLRPTLASSPYAARIEAKMKAKRNLIAGGAGSGGNSSSGNNGRGGHYHQHSNSNYNNNNNNISRQGRRDHSNQYAQSQ